MPISPEQFTKALADLTRLRIMNLLLSSEELCVCEFTYVLELDQPKISRHLSLLRKAGLVQDRRAGQWVYYRVHTELSSWAQDALSNLSLGFQDNAPYSEDLARLTNMPQSLKASACG